MSEQNFDLVVLGAGSGGYAAALRASQLGLTVGLIEKGKVGGTCLHVGCIPTKALLHSAEVADVTRESASYGVTATYGGIDIAAVTKYREAIVASKWKGLLGLIKARGPAYHQLCHHVATALHGYQGPVGVMSFNPRVGHFFARHFAHVLRGLVVSEKGKKGPRGWIERRASLAWARPDFLAYDIRDLPSGFAESAQRRGLRVLTWTVRTMAERARASEHADQIIYEAEAR